MKTKPKLIVCALIFVAGGIGNIFFSSILHGLLSRQIETMRFIPLSECISSLTSSKQHFLMFVCLQGFILILSVMYFLTNLRPYQSDLNTITPDIQTPKAVGQYQHGSSRWLKDSEKEKAFRSFTLDPNDPFIKSLIKTGYDDLDFLKEKT